MNFANLKIGNRLALAFGMVILLALCSTVLALYELAAIESNLEDVVTDNNVKIKLNNDMSESVHVVSRVTRTLVLLHDKAEIERELGKIAAAREVYDKSWEALQKFPASETGKANRTKIAAAAAVARPFNTKVIELAREGKDTEAIAVLLGEAAPATQKWQATIDENIVFQEANNVKQHAKSSADYERAVYLTIILNAFAVISAILAAIGVTRSITRPLARAVTAADALAAGDLTVRIEVGSADETGQLLGAMQKMQGALTRLITEIKAQSSAAAEGDFSKKIDLSDKQGFGREIGEILNRLALTTDEGLKDIDRVATSLANGDLSQKIVRRYPGVFGRTSDGVNSTVDSLGKMIGEIKGVVDAAANRGDFSARLETKDKAGYGKDLAELLNRLSSVIETGLNDVSGVLQVVARGDLTRMMTGDYVGVFDRLRGDVNATVERLRELIGQIKNATEAINTASTEIAAGNQDLSRRTEEQASSLEQTSSSMEELNSTVKSNAENANRANRLAKTAKDGIVKGGVAVKQVVATMSEIQASSKQIADIVGVIDSIAFQTNILALNAAVEAARAGEQGRGFAVVASEVRNLAQRSATAAKEIKDLIAASVSTVEAGAQQVEEAGASIDTVVDGFSEVAQLITDIANASREQSAGIEQVTQAVGSMDEVTQQNAALVEEAAAAAESLEEQARSLLQSVAMFKLAQDGGRRLPALTGAARRLAAPTSASA